MISNVRAVFLALIAVFGLATPVSAAPNDIVVIITNQDYAGTVPKVEYAERDGEAIAKAARDVMQVPPDRIVHVKNLTYAGFLDWFGADGEGGAELERLKAKLGRDSNIVFYYSGHGMPAKRSKASDPEPVLLPVDTSPARADRFGMPTSVVRKALLTMQREKASDGRVILILDACFSGSSGGGRLSSETSAVRISPSAVRAAEPRLVELAASGPEQEANWDRERRHGIFTDGVLEGLYGAADANKDGSVTAGELATFVARYVDDRVTRLFPSPRRFQTPSFSGEAPTRLSIVAATTPARDPKAKALIETRCKTVPASTDTAEIKSFLATCGFNCPCRAALDARLAALAVLSATCEAEAFELDRLAKRGAAARAELEALAKGASCPAMKAKAGDLLASLDRSASDKERKAKEAAKLKAREEAEKKAKEETGTAPTGPSDPATSAYCDRLKTYLAARAAAKDASAVRYVTGQSLCPDLQDEAKAILRTLDDAGGTPAPTPLPADADPARGIEPGSGRGFVDHLRDGSACSHCPELVVVPADRFMIGSPSSEAYRSPDEGPTREIAIARPFAIGRMEVTRGQFRAFVDSTGHQPAQNCSIWDGQNWKIDQTMTWLSPGYEQDEDHPVVCVSHADAVKYAEWLSEQTGHVYQLPSEAEWEYAARAGTSERYPFGASDGQICRFANVADSAAKKVNPSWTTVRCSDGFANTAPVGHFEASAWGLHDMIGNVSEWTDDCATGSYDGYPGDGSPAKTGDCERRPHRGAGWSSTSEEARVARRSFYFGEERFPTVGFRLVRVIAD